jgi:kynurenine formamidase
VEFEEWTGIESDGYFLRRFSTSEHGGTHFTAPASYFPGGRTVDEYPASDLVKPTVVIDIRDRCIGNRDYALSPSDLVAWEGNHGKVEPDTLVLLLTGWSDRWNDPEDYLGTGFDGNLRFPGFGVAAAALLIEERGAAGLGTDTAGLEPGTDDTLGVSKLVLSEPRIVLENLANLHLLPPVGVTVVIGALRLVGGSGSPAAVTAFVPRKN